MAIPFLNHLDLRNVSELQNAILHKTTQASASNVEGKIIYDTGTNTIKYNTDGTNSGWISLTGDTNTFRTVQADGSAIGSTETLNLIGGDNITLSESGGAITITGAAAMAFQLEDGDGTEVTINNGKEVKFVEGGGIDIDWTDITTGSDSDPYDLTFTNTDKGSSQNIFKTVATNPAHSGSLTFASTQNLVADSNNDTLKLFDGTGIKIEGATTDDIVRIRIATGGVDTAQLADDAVDGDKIADNALNSEHYTDGSVDNVHLANSSITINGSDISLGGSVSTPNTDTKQTISNDTTNADRFVTFVTNATGAQTGKSQADFKYNPSTGTLKVTNLEVSGTQTIQNETVQVVENNTILFEGATADDFETKLTIEDPTADRTATIPNASGTVNLGFSTTVGGATTAEVTHNLNSRNVIVQLFDSSSYETVNADVVRTTVNTVDLTFAAAPASGDITVLVTRVA
tara:strand:- start:7167 stop:8546 length:1380 start_codon:yes stop_codon:yes gene_type:complete